MPMGNSAGNFGLECKTRSRSTSRLILSTELTSEIFLCVTSGKKKISTLWKVAVTDYL